MLPRTLTLEVELGEHFSHCHLLLRVPQRESVLIGTAAESAPRELLEELSRLVATYGTESEP